MSASLNTNLVGSLGSRSRGGWSSITWQAMLGSVGWKVRLRVVVSPPVVRPVRVCGLAQVLVRAQDQRISEGVLRPARAVKGTKLGPVVARVTVKVAGVAGRKLGWRAMVMG